MSDRTAHATPQSTVNHETGETSSIASGAEGPRRHFLARLLAGGTVLSALTLVGSAAAAEERGRGRGGRGNGSPGAPGGRGGERRGGGNPAELAARLIQEFDADGDGALNATELANALTQMNERRQGGRPDGGPGGRPGGGPGGSRGNGQGRGPGNGQGRPGSRGAGNRPGGGRPQRPAAE